jgi:hypothetical protein
MIWTTGDLLDKRRINYVAALLGLAAAIALVACGGGAGGGADGSSGGDGSGPASPPVAAIVGKGSPNGAPTSQTFDASGGKLSSSDGRLDVVVPPGAFASTTTLTIQPITSTLPNGLASAYRLSPDGMTFTTPITLVFHLSDVEARAIESTWVATQHADGGWYSQPGQTRDTGAKTVSVPAKHFSDWDVAQTLYLSPQKTRVRTGTPASFVPKVLAVADGDELANPNADEFAVPAPTQLNSTDAATVQARPTWQVNGVEGGDTTIGQISDNAMTGSYKAPSSVPTPATVTVSATLTLGNRKVIATAEVTIIDQEKWNGSSHITTTDGNVIDATFVFAEVAGDSPSDKRFNIESGQVHVKVPATTSAGCALSINPKDYDIGPNDGTLSAKAELGGFAMSGIGTTVFLANYVTVCPNGTGAMQLAVQAPWWPSNPSAPDVQTIGVEDTSVNFVVNTPAGSGTVHLTRQ